MSATCLLTAAHLDDFRYPAVSRSRICWNNFFGLSEGLSEEEAVAMEVASLPPWNVSLLTTGRSVSGFGISVFIEANAVWFRRACAILA